MLDLLKGLINVKTAIIVLTLVVIGFIGYQYIQLNGANLSWCATNINSCHVARIQALERDLNTLVPSK
jgi:hypothetical protein